MLGGLAIYTEAPLREFEVRIFERTSMITSVVLLSKERRESANRLQMSAIVHGLIGRPQNSLPRSMAQAAHHGVDLSQPVLMAILEMEQIGRASGRERVCQ